jgi:hypothetical protein
MNPGTEIIVLICLIIVIFDYFREVGKKTFYFSCWVCIFAALCDPKTGGFTNFGNLIGAFLIFMAFNQRRKRESRSKINKNSCEHCKNHFADITKMVD